MSLPTSRSLMHGYKYVPIENDYKCSMAKSPSTTNLDSELDSESFSSDNDDLNQTNRTINLDNSNYSNKTSQHPHPHQQQNQNSNSHKSQMINSFQSIYLFIVNCSFLLSYLVIYLNTYDKLTGLVFTLSTLVMLTCLIFFYPTYTLTISGYINLRILKWIYSILGISIFFYLIRNHVQSCSLFLISFTFGIKLFRELPYLFPNTFTYNELVLLVSIISNAIFTFLMHILKVIPGEFEEVIVVEQAFVWLIFILIICKNVKQVTKSIVVFGFVCVLVLGVYFLPACGYLLNQNPFIWLYNYLFYTNFQRIFLFVYWIGLFNCLALVVLVQKYLSSKSKFNYQTMRMNEEKLNIIAAQHGTLPTTVPTTSVNLSGSNDKTEFVNITNDLDKNGSIGHISSSSNELTNSKNETYLMELSKHERRLTSIRKLFHMLICFVYILGFVYDRHLLFLCSYGMLILLLLIETIRYYKIGKISHIIQDMMGLFVDEKDSDSKLVLSHVYLLVGLSYPIWISNFDEFNVSQLSGLITVGIGDSFASLIGSRYGKHKLPGGSKKSYEGSLALIASEFFVFYIMHLYNLLNLFDLTNICLMLISAFTTSFAEAFTNDNDNLILPIVAFPFLCLIK